MCAIHSLDEYMYEDHIPIFKLLLRWKQVQFQGAAEEDRWDGGSSDDEHGCVDTAGEEEYYCGLKNKVLGWYREWIKPMMQPLLSATVLGRDAYTAIPRTPYVLIKRQPKPAIVLIRAHTPTTPASSSISALLRRSRRTILLVPALVLALAFYLLLRPTPATTRTAQIYDHVHSPYLPPNLSPILPLPVITALSQYLAIAHAHLRIHGHHITAFKLERRGSDMLALESALRRAPQTAKRFDHPVRIYMVAREARTRVVCAVLGLDAVRRWYNGTEEMNWPHVAEQEMRRLMGGYLRGAVWSLMDEAEE
ncbi:hypothetical protein EJ03DRAFT_339634 [Teratosphaeria nubilosa]|uniref:Uncharacterized protein n=1 Tax=Teratosphaeria nubilosa TaxID=161662 RepID=A0A6G1KX83_9PEZI|nr:hypothetical protein EJ03DRAFT_339634 [Teratosphaeria nubilosa]